jgi:hypothetical protein
MIGPGLSTLNLPCGFKTNRSVVSQMGTDQTEAIEKPGRRAYK